MSRRLLLALSPALLCAACVSEPIRFAATGDEVRAATAELTSFVRAGWHLPLEVRVHLSNAEDGQPLAPAQAAREEAQAAAQLAAVREAYAHAAFDFFAVDVDIGRAAAPGAKISGPLRRLELTLPPPGQGPHTVVEAHAIMAALGDAFADRAGPSVDVHEGQRAWEAFGASVLR